MSFRFSPKATDKVPPNRKRQGLFSVVSFKKARSTAIKRGSAGRSLTAVYGLVLMWLPQGIQSNQYVPVERRARRYLPNELIGLWDAPIAR